MKPFNHIEILLSLRRLSHKIILYNVYNISLFYWNMLIIFKDKLEFFPNFIILFAFTVVIHMDHLYYIHNFTTLFFMQYKHFFSVE